MNDSDSCVPWFYPAKDNRVRKHVPPKQYSKTLTYFEEHIPKNACKHGFPVYITTVYKASIWYAVLQRYALPNIVTNDLENGRLNPAPWINIASNDCNETNETVPCNIDTFPANTTAIVTRLSVNSAIVDQDAELDFIFLPELKKDPTHNAFASDSGINNHFFSDKAIKL